MSLQSPASSDSPANKVTVTTYPRQRVQFALKWMSSLSRVFNASDARAKQVWLSAAEAGNLGIIELALSQERSPKAQDKWLNQRAAWGRTALWLASHGGHLPVVKALLGARASTEKGDRLDGSRPLHAAVYHGHHTVVCALCEAGADVHAANFYGRTPWDLIAVSLTPISVLDPSEQRAGLDRTLFAAGGHGRLALGMPILEAVAPTNADAVVPRRRLHSSANPSANSEMGMAAAGALNGAALGGGAPGVGRLYIEVGGGSSSEALDEAIDANGSATVQGTLLMLAPPNATTGERAHSRDLEPNWTPTPQCLTASLHLLDGAPPLLWASLSVHTPKRFAARFLT